MVSPHARRSGLGRRLLAVATAEALKRTMLPALDVVTNYTAAIAFYETEGWRIGQISVPCSPMPMT
jgi:GNAT superfamily N-acetyltransferase